MKAIRFFFLALLLLQFSCNSQNRKLNGVSFVASRDTISHETIKPLLATNTNTVALMPFAFVRGVNSPNVIYSQQRQWFGETPNGIIQYAKAFNAKNISIMLKPQLWVSRGEFTGFIEMKNEEDWKTLENSYADFILLFAKIAADINAEIFCIGTELEKFILNRPDYWRNLISKIRKVYKGKLTYAANWDEFKRVPFWDVLDFIGVDAYFPLSDKKTPSISDLEQGWQEHKKTIITLKDKYKKPVLFTEFGYRSVDFTGKEPWKADRMEGNVNLIAQTNALKAIHNQFWKEEWFAGGYVWKWFVKHNRVGGENNNRFTPQNKPSEKLLKELYAN